MPHAFSPQPAHFSLPNVVFAARTKLKVILKALFLSYVLDSIMRLKKWFQCAKIGDRNRLSLVIYLNTCGSERITCPYPSRAKTYALVHYNKGEL